MCIDMEKYLFNIYDKHGNLMYEKMECVEGGYKGKFFNSGMVAGTIAITNEDMKRLEWHSKIGCIIEE